MVSVNRLGHGEMKNRLILVFSDNHGYSNSAGREKYLPNLEDRKDQAATRHSNEADHHTTNLQHLFEKEQLVLPTAAAASSISGSSTLCSSVADTSVATEQVRRQKKERKRAKAEARRQARAVVARAWEVPCRDDKITLTPDLVPIEQERHNLVYAPTYSCSEPSTSRHQFATSRSGKTLPSKSVFKLYEVAELVERLIEQHGSWSIGFLDAACDVFLTADRTAAISFKRVNSSGRSVAIIFGDPLCPATQCGIAISEFKTFCRNNHMLFGFVGADYATRKRWLTLQFASERMVNPESNPILSGQIRPAFVRPLELKAPETYSADKNSRKPMHLFLYAPTRRTRDVELEIRAQKFYDEWCAQKGQAAHATTFSDLFALSGVMTYIYTKSPFDGSLLGLVAIMKVANGGYLLDPVVAHREAPSCTTDFLRLAAMAEVKKREGKAMSFGAEPRPEIAQISGMVWPATEIARRRHRQGFQALGLAAKRHVPQKFALDPDLERPLYLVMAKSCVHVRSVLSITKAICAANNFELGNGHQANRHQRRDGGTPEIAQSVSLSSASSSGSSLVPSATGASTTSLVNPEKPKLPQKLLDFVSTLDNRNMTSSAYGTQRAGKEDIQQRGLETSSLEYFLLPHECLVVHTPERRPEVPKSSDTSDKVADCVSGYFQQLDSLDEGSADICAKVNRIYFNLGRTYQLFCDVTVQDSKSVLPSEQQHRFASLCEEVIIKCDRRECKELSNREQSALQKRLQRARKFLLLVDVFGMPVLDSVPEVSVTRVDALRVSDLRALSDGTFFKAEVESIRRKQDSLIGDISSVSIDSGASLVSWVVATCKADGIVPFRTQVSNPFILRSSARKATRTELRN
ncbi:hypothetical protein QFC24_001989 [Naganishia onofrii]|uniref:Uncharacterized protein n=1 Tax=Naganishia onofrii TaxID=1851511 RepID=A0ACC2XRI1_9TREE|nr:hypothetical protein QFC24_001989 [Naganishia onofrii]